MQVQDNLSGSRALIASIINQAIVDGLYCKNPKPDFIVKKFKNKYGKIIIKYFFMINNLLKYLPKNKINKLLMIRLVRITLKYLKKLRNLQRYQIAWTGRNFLNSKNINFSYYCNLLDIDPEYIHKEYEKFFHKFDKGLIVRKKIHFVK